MEERRLIDTGEYWVLGIDLEQYDAENPEMFTRGLLQDQTNSIIERAFRAYIGIMPSSPVNFQNFSFAVNSYNELPPLNFPNPLETIGGKKIVRCGRKVNFCISICYAFSDKCGGSVSIRRCIFICQSFSTCSR